MYTVYNWLTYIALPHLNTDTTKRVIFFKITAHGVRNEKKWCTRFWFTNYEALDIYKQLLTDKIFSYLPTNWMDKLEEVNGDSIASEKSIFCTQPYSRAWDKMHTSSFSVGQCNQASIRTNRDNIRKFIVYILLLV